MACSQILVDEFGAVADGVTVNTASLQNALDMLDKQGGGTLAFGPGVYLTGTLHLRSGGGGGGAEYREFAGAWFNGELAQRAGAGLLG